MMKLVSVIIPVYNGEAFMGKAIESCLAQTYKNIEIILINDGSEDDSEKVAQSYAAKDERVKVYTQQNAGQANARNQGIGLAKGEYIQFLDCDDTLESEAIQILVEELNKSPEVDFLMFGFNIYGNDKLLRKPHPKNNIYHLNEGYEKFEEIKPLFVSVCNKIYTKRYLKKGFCETAVFAEDKIFNYQNLDKNTVIKAIDKCLYNVYLDELDGVNTRYKKGKIFDFLYSASLEENILSEIFDIEFDKEKHRSAALSTLGYIICNMANKTAKHEFKQEIETAFELNYFKCIILCIGKVQLYYKVLFYMLRKKLYGTARFYCSLMMFAYRFIKR